MAGVNLSRGRVTTSAEPAEGAPPTRARSRELISLGEKNTGKVARQRRPRLRVAPGSPLASACRVRACKAVGAQDCTRLGVPAELPLAPGNVSRGRTIVRASCLPAPQLQLLFPLQLSGVGQQFVSLTTKVVGKSFGLSEPGLATQLPSHPENIYSLS